jgi:hypothetical protein
MVLGLSFTELFALLTMFGSIIGTYVTLNVRITAIEIRVKQMEHLRDEKERKDEQIRVENRQEHQMIIEKIDKLLERISK